MLRSLFRNGFPAFVVAVMGAHALIAGYAASSGALVIATGATVAVIGYAVIVMHLFDQRGEATAA